MNNWKLYMHISPSNKRYIGITSQSVSNRWKNGRGYINNFHFYNAIKKYGWDNFEHVIIADKLSESTAKELEKYYIDKYNTKNQSFGYNNTDGGDGISGYHHTIETKLKISQSEKGKKCKDVSIETRNKISIALSGKKRKPLTEETKRKISIANTGKKYGERSQEVKNAISVANRGRVMSDEQRKKLSDAHRGKTISSETRKKMSESMKGLRYINNGCVNRRVRENELSDYLKQGYVLGIVHKKRT